MSILCFSAALPQEVHTICQLLFTGTAGDAQRGKHLILHSSDISLYSRAPA